MLTTFILSPVYSFIHEHTRDFTTDYLILSLSFPHGMKSTIGETSDCGMGNLVSKPGRGKKIFLPHNRPHWSWGTSRLLHSVYRGFVPECDIDHLHLLAPKLKMGGVVPLLPLCACIGELRNDLYPYFYAFTIGVDTLSV